MEPATERQRTIARLVDERASQGDLTVSALGDIARMLQFGLTSEEAQFLVRYIIWRLDHPTHALPQI